MKFQVERSSWTRGKGVAYLLDKQGGRCCLGFLGRAQQLTDEEMLGVGSPDVLWHGYSNSEQEQEKTARAFAGLLISDGPLHAIGMYNNRACNGLMRVNDAILRDGDPTTDLVIESEKDREAELTKRFAAIGIEVEFVD